MDRKKFRLQSYEWCWICLEACPPDHYFQEDSPCFGKQFNENSVENDLILMRLMAHDIYYIGTFFIFYLSAFIINMIIQNRNILLSPNGINNNNNFNNNNNYSNNNDIEMNINNNNNNNLNQGLLNQEIRNDNLINRNRNQLHNNNIFSLRQKFGLFVLGECILTTILVILIVTNGFFLIPIITMLNQMSFVTNKHSKMLSVITFFILFMIFFILGFMFSCIWFIFFTLNLGYLIIRI
jgi:hypothetical protein